uniref:Uncharacterized protein n=1 Tax=Megaviridae environmental sample TaxID=1737588 RepID=A0A5J6VJU0_9VIRU|nr:MAG: hypothetical protein [Megaviridae environmental sample]
MSDYPIVCKDVKCTMYSIFIVLCSVIYALIEIEVEGKKGWAEDLPTPNIGSSKKSLTIYHLYFFLFMLLVMNSVFFMGVKFRMKEFIFIFSMLLMFFAVEDISWFILNPYYTLKNLDKAWWHHTWQCIPLIYIILPIISFFLATKVGYRDTILNCFFTIGVSIIVLLIISPLYHSFYKKTHPEYYDIYKIDAN